MQSKATTVQQYLDELPPERRSEIARVRQLVLANLDPAIAEGMQYGMIGYSVPHTVYPPGYHVDPSSRSRSRHWPPRRTTSRST
jgi:hypothetical protein